MFSSQLSATALENFCRTLSRSLNAGLDPIRILRMEEKRGGSALSVASGDIADSLSKGDSLKESFDQHSNLFPLLMLSMIQVGEETGSLPEILNELSRHYGEQAMLQRKLKSQITMPVFQFGMAIAVIAILILVLGFLPKAQGQPDYDPLGWGLKGATGSIFFLGIIISIIIGGVLLWKTVLSNVAFKAKISAIFVNLPMVGAYLKESALGKFSIGLGLTLNSPMSTKKAIRLSMEITSNDAFIQACQPVLASIKKGQPIVEALSKCSIFPEEYLAQIEVAEEVGSIPETCKRLALQHSEEAGRQLSIIFYLMGGAVWLCTAGFIIFIIARMFGSYLGMLGV
ncbi:MAG: type II secretion system F family protein [Gemmataceae bacterium]